MCKSCSRLSRERLQLLESRSFFFPKKLELLSATPRVTLTHLSCSQNFRPTSYLDERTLTYEPIFKFYSCKCKCKLDPYSQRVYINSFTNVGIECFYYAQALLVPFSLLKVIIIIIIRRRRRRRIIIRIIIRIKSRNKDLKKLF